MKVYDCFSFCNTLEVLDIRFNVLDPYVDYFVLTESVETFTGRPKKLYYDENKSLFSKFKDKIIHVVTDKIQDDPALSRMENVFRRKTLQKNSVSQGLENCDDDDVILFSDADEIPPDITPSLQYLMREPYFVCFYMRMYYWYLNWLWKRKWEGTVMAKYWYVKDNRRLDFDWWRSHRRDGKKRGGGWHFTQTGDTERRVENMLGYEDKERIFKGQGDPIALAEYIEDRIANKLGFGIAEREVLNKHKATPVQIDETFPEYIQNNQEKFKDLIHD